MRRMRFSRWNILSIAALIALCFTTFQPVIQATIVHPSIAGNIFDITAYVASLSELYSPWLSLMMSEGSGQRTSALLTAGTVALYALCAIAVIALVLAVASIACNAAGRRKPGRITGIIGYVLALIVPIASIAIVAIVQFEMSSDIISIAVLDARPVCYAQIIIAIVGIIGTVFATRVVTDPKANKANKQTETKE